jgi:hypothetical protein
VIDAGRHTLGAVMAVEHGSSFAEEHEARHDRRVAQT